jgi:hypothetical protein
MPFYQLHINCDFDGLSLIGFPPSTEPQFRLELSCGNCGEVNKNAVISLDDAHESEDGKTILHYAAICKACKVSIKAWICKLKPLIKEGNLKIKGSLPYINEYYCQIGTPLSQGDDDDDDDGKKSNPQNTLFTVLEVRGAEVKDFEVINTEFHATNGKEFFSVGDLSADGFYDVNGDNESVSVTLLGYKVQ